MKQVTMTCDLCGRTSDDEKDFISFVTHRNGIRISHDFCRIGCLQEVGIAVLNIIDKGGELPDAMQELWGSVPLDQQIQTMDIVLAGRTKEAKDDGKRPEEDSK